MTSSANGLTNETNVCLPDLSDILDQIDFDKKPISHGALVGSGYFGVHRWGSLAMELIAYPEREDDILDHFGLTKYQFLQLQENPLFQAIYKDTRSSMEAMATNGGFQLNARRLAEQGLEVLENVMRSGEDKDRLKAVEMVARLGNLDPSILAKANKEAVQVNTGVQLVVNFSDDMRVPAAFAGSNNVVIEAEVDEN